MKRKYTEYEKIQCKIRTSKLRNSKNIFDQLAFKNNLELYHIDIKVYRFCKRIVEHPEIVYLNIDQLTEYELIFEQCRMKYVINKNEQRIIADVSSIV